MAGTNLMSTNQPSGTPLAGTSMPRSPLKVVIWVMLALEVVLLACLGLAKLLAPDTAAASLDVPILLINAIVAAVLLSRLRWWRAAGFRAVERPRDLLLMVPPVVVLLISVIAFGVDYPTGSTAAVLVVFCLLVAFQEEAIFRGVLLHALMRYGTWVAVLGSAALFGLVHLNSLLVGRDPAFVAVQVLTSFLGGIGLAALRLRLGSIWPLIALHAINDFLQFSAAAGTAVADASPLLLGAKIGVAVLMAAYGLVLLRVLKQPAAPLT
jgi:hypothetical protein